MDDQNAEELLDERSVVAGTAGVFAKWPWGASGDEPRDRRDTPATRGEQPIAWRE